MRLEETRRRLATIVEENNRLREENRQLRQQTSYQTPSYQNPVTSYGNTAFTLPTEPTSGLEPAEQTDNPQLTGQLLPSGSSTGQHYQPQSHPPLSQAQMIPYPRFGTRRGESHLSNS